MKKKSFPSYVNEFCRKAEKLCKEASRGPWGWQGESLVKPDEVGDFFCLSGHDGLTKKQRDEIEGNEPDNFCYCEPIILKLNSVTVGELSDDEYGSYEIKGLEEILDGKIDPIETSFDLKGGDAMFIAEARSLLPQALRIIRRLKRENRGLKKGYETFL